MSSIFKNQSKPSSSEQVQTKNKPFRVKRVYQVDNGRSKCQTLCVGFRVCFHNYKNSRFLVKNGKDMIGTSTHSSRCYQQSMYLPKKKKRNSFKKCDLLQSYYSSLNAMSFLVIIALQLHPFIL